MDEARVNEMLVKANSTLGKRHLLICSNFVKFINLHHVMICSIRIFKNSNSEVNEEARG